MKLTKQQTKVCKEITELLTKPSLTDDEVSFVYEHYLPAMAINPTLVGAHFTPVRRRTGIDEYQNVQYDNSIGTKFSVFCDCDNDVVLDLGAGIGALSHSLLSCGRCPKKIIALEYVKDFYDIGKKLLHNVEWINGSLYDQRVIESLKKQKIDWVISNPPFGVKVEKELTGWLKYVGQSDLMAVEVGLSVARDMMAILPTRSLPWRFSGRQTIKYEASTQVQKFRTIHPDIHFNCTSVDTDIYAKDWQTGISAVEIVHLTRET